MLLDRGSRQLDIEELLGLDSIIRLKVWSNLCGATWYLATAAGTESISFHVRQGVRQTSGGGGGGGGFFQALNVKWQHRLGAPRPDETFYTLYDRARALEYREKQYSSILDRTPSGDHQQKPVKKEQKSSTKGSSGEGGNLKSHKKVIRHRGDNVKKVGHIARNCLHSVEAPGRRLNASVTTSTNTVGRIQPVLPD